MVPVQNLAYELALAWDLKEALATHVTLSLRMQSRCPVEKRGERDVRRELYLVPASLVEAPLTLGHIMTKVFPPRLGVVRKISTGWDEEAAIRFAMSGINPKPKPRTRG
jgi:hypothetical protein